MKAAKITIRILILLLTSIWGVFFGLLTPIYILNEPLFEILHNIAAVWAIMAVVGYFIPCFLVMLDLSKIAAGISIVGTIMTLYIHSALTSLHKTGIGEESPDASFMYLPQIFMTILTILYVFIINPHYITQAQQKRKDRHNAPTPSILDAPERK
jgi:hypothetical protein